MSTFDPLSFFDEDVSPAAAEAAAAPVVAEPVAPVVQEPAAPVATEKPEFEGAPSGYVPVGALQEERKKRQSLEEQVRDAKAQAPKVEAAAPVQTAPVPAPGTPEHAAYLQDQLVATQIDNRFNQSENRFTAAHGAEETAKLQKWVEAQDVYFFQRLLGTNDPYAEAKKEYDVAQAATAYSAIPQDRFAAFQKWEADQAALAAGGQVAATPAATTQPAVIAPSAFKSAQKPLTEGVSSGSILTTPTAGKDKVGDTPAAPGAAFSTTFK